jgi:hypothetical protein
MEVLSDHPLLLQEATGTASNSSLADDDIDGSGEADEPLYVGADADEATENSPEKTTVDAWALLPTPAAAATTRVMADLSPDPSVAVFAF